MSTDYEIHRIKWDNWAPSSIKTLTYNQESNLLAIGREDGEIEICQPSEKYYVQLRIPGQKDFNLQKLVWSSSSQVTSESGRLFGISLRGFLFEVDLISLTFKNINDTYGGATWCLAANPKNTILAVGCEDGNMRLFDYTKHPSLKNNLQYVRTYAGSVGNRVLSLVFHPTQEKLFFGCADGTIRCVDEKNGGSIFRLTGDFGRGLNTYIWSLCILVNHHNHSHSSDNNNSNNNYTGDSSNNATTTTTLVSGDNRGHIQFWDADVGVLSQSFQQHTADILCITQGIDENQVFASGVDSKISCFQRSATTSSVTGGSDMSGSSGIWYYTTSHRPHSHDVYALCACIPTSSSLSSSAATSKSTNNNTNAITTTTQSSSSLSSSYFLPPVLVSGGVDCKLCTYDLPCFSGTRPHWILPVPATGLVSSSEDYTVVAVKHKQYIDIWNVQLHQSSQNSNNNNNNNNNNSNHTKIIDNTAAANTDEVELTETESTSKKRGRKPKVTTASTAVNVVATTNVIKADDATTTAMTASTNNNSSNKAAAHNEDRFQLQLRLNMKGSDSVYTHCVSGDGHWLAVTSAVAGTRLWCINKNTTNSSNNIASNQPYLKSVVLPSKVAKYLCHCISFSTDSKRLIVVANSGMIYVFSLQTDNNTTVVVALENKKSKKSRKSITVTNYDSNNNTQQQQQQQSCTAVTEINFKKTVDEYIHEYTSSNSGHALCYVASKITVSADGRYLAVADSSNYGIVYIYDNDSTRLHWRLPRQQYTTSSSSNNTNGTATTAQSSTTISANSHTHPVTSLLFHPSLEHSSTLFVCYANNIFQFFNIETCLIKNWSIQNPPHQFPTCLTQKSIPIENAFFHPTINELMVLYSKNSTIFVNISDKSTTTIEVTATTTTKASKKSKTANITAIADSANTTNSNNCIVANPRIITHTDQSNKSNKTIVNDNNASSNDDMVIVEKYRGLVHMGFVNQNSNNNTYDHPVLVVIENPWIRVLEQLPDPLTRKRYGT